MAKTGKIFGSSNNVYDDQAKILFDYYKQCAERIVAQEEEIEQEVDSLLEDRKIVEESLTGWWNKFLNFILFRTSTLKAQMLMIDNKLEKLNKDKKNIFRDYKVKKMGVVYVPIAEQVKYDKNSFLVDFTGVVQPSEVMVQVPRIIRKTKRILYWERNVLFRKTKRTIFFITTNI